MLVTLMLAIDTVVLGLLVVIVGLLCIRLLMMIQRCDRMEHDIRLSMAGKLLPVRNDAILRAPASGMQPTPPPIPKP